VKQRIFVGSSGEAKPVCAALVAQLSATFEVVPWYISFPAGSTTIGSLLDGLQTHDFGVFVLSADDPATVRGKNVTLPRDNVLFEAGLFMGMHGLRRTFLVCPSGTPDLHLLSDIAGVSYVGYDPRASTMDIAVAPVVHQLQQAIALAIKTERAIKVKVSPPKHSLKPGLTWPLKLTFKIKNAEREAVVVESVGFRFVEARPAPNQYVLGGSDHNVAFRRWKMDDPIGNDQYHEVVVLQPGDEVEAWVALDEKHSEVELLDMHRRKSLGVWSYRVTWLGAVPKAQDDELAV
jgi:hypothetical protein